MFNHFVPATLLALFVTEAAVLAFSLVTGAALRFQGTPSLFLSGDVDLRWPAFAFVMVLLGILAAFGMYSMDLPADVASMLVRLAGSFLIGLAAMSVVFYVLPSTYIGRGVLFISWGLALATTVALRMAFLRYWSRQNLLTRRVLVLGTGQDALALDQIEKNPHAGNFHIVGFLRVGEKDERVPASRILGDGAPIRELIERHRISEIVMAATERRQTQFRMDELLQCKLAGVAVTELSTFHERERGLLQVEWASWIVFRPGFEQHPVEYLLKSICDVCASVILLLATLPVMFVTAIAILLEDGRPIFYRQERVGRRGRPFQILKFRSMRKDAEKDGQARWATSDDARITRVGYFIRLLRIDELPQAVNVLRGEMSLVGPRPERPSFVDELTRQIPHYGIRHIVKPGVTGWAQVRYRYSACIGSAAEKLKYDLYYVKNHSLFLDFIILIETIGVVLMGKGAR